ncbi:1-aminocyclopropane-1-carboxylate oxidase 1 [Linum grandiflorum]
MEEPCESRSGERASRAHRPRRIILLLQDDQVPGLEFLKYGEWVQIPPLRTTPYSSTLGIRWRC